MSLISTIVIALLCAGIGSLITYFLTNRRAEAMEASLETRLDALEEKQKKAQKEMQKALGEIQEINSILQLSLRELPQPADAGETSRPLQSGPVSKEFFMAIPNKDGSFHAHAYSESFKPTVSLYRFKEIDQGRAEFEFYPDAGGLRDALNFSSAYLEPACEELNDIRPDTQNVQTVEKGLAERMDNRWVIMKKTKIRYQ